VDLNPRLRLLIPLIAAAGFFMEQLDTTVIATAMLAMAAGPRPLRRGRILRERRPSYCNLHYEDVWWLQEVEDGRQG
jgi:hypothetical protein